MKTAKMNHTIEGLKQELAQLAARHASGALPDARYAQSKAALERRLLDLVLAGNAAPAGGSPAAPDRPSARLLTLLTLGVLLLAVAGYLWKGSPGPAPAAQAVEQGSEAHSSKAEQIAAMTDKLAERLKDRPDDVEGWTMLARSYAVLGRHPEALQAFGTALKLRPNDPVLITDYADSLAVSKGSRLDGEPIQLVQRALQLDPNNLKALYLSGTYAYNLQDYAGAVKTWEKLVQVAPPGNVFAREVEPAIAEARQLGGMATPARSDAKAPAAGAGSVRGTVTLSAALAQQAQPEDTVFVFARAAEGSRMPLAILRKQVKDLPLSFTLDDSMAMSPASALSGASKVIVGARISKSGNAMPQPGDLSGQSAPVEVGASGLQIEIRDTIKP